MDNWVEQFEKEEVGQRVSIFIIYGWQVHAEDFHFTGKRPIPYQQLEVVAFWRGS